MVSWTHPESTLRQKRKSDAPAIQLPSSSLDEYKKYSAGEKITHISIDASELEYISSAGLRTLLIMQKDMTGSRIRISGAGKAVSDILEQTGFTNILDTD